MKKDKKIAKNCCAKKSTKSTVKDSSTESNSSKKSNTKCAY